MYIIICFPHLERTSPGCIGMEILHSGAYPSFFYMKLLFLHLELFAVISCSTRSRIRLPYTDYLGLDFGLILQANRMLKILGLQRMTGRQWMEGCVTPNNQK